MCETDDNLNIRLSLSRTDRMRTTSRGVVLQSMTVPRFMPDVSRWLWVVRHISDTRASRTGVTTPIISIPSEQSCKNDDISIGSEGILGRASRCSIRVLSSKEINRAPIILESLSRIADRLSMLGPRLFTSVVIRPPRLSRNHSVSDEESRHTDDSSISEKVP